MKRAIFVIFISMFFLASCSGSGNESQADSVPATVPAEFAGKTNPLGADAAAAGAAIFKNNCTACHGEQGHGDGPAGTALSPRPSNLPELASTVGDDYLFWRISAGRDGTAMVAWKGVLTDEQIWQVISFIRTIK